MRDVFHDAVRVKRESNSLILFCQFFYILLRSQWFSDKTLFCFPALKFQVSDKYFTIFKE